MFLLVVLIAAQVDFIVGTFIGPVDNEEKAKGFIGYNGERHKQYEAVLKIYFMSII